MAQKLLSLLILLLLLCFVPGELASAASPTDFIRSSCRTTRYPDLCFRCLAAYAPAVRRSPRELARAALAVSLDRARSASAFVARLGGGANSPRSRDTGAVRDCIENMADGVDRLRKSAEELRGTGGPGSAEFAWHMSNVQTWCSAALTDENTCLDSLSEYGSPELRSAVRQKVVEVAQVTSNALTLVNRMESG